MLNIFNKLFIIVCGIVITSSAAAEKEETEQLITVINQRLGNETSTQLAKMAGQQRALLCSYCHGEDGNSKKPEIPNLAGQNPVYLLNQIEKFSDGRRKNYVMNSLAKKLTSEDRINLAIFYSSMTVKRVPADAQLVEKGKSIYSHTCSSCHGPRGAGKQDFARLAGQRSEYVKLTLQRFKENALNPYENTKKIRQSAIMESIAKTLADDQILSLAAYISQLQ